MLTSPTSLKSFILKFIEVVHMLELADQDEEEFMQSHNAAAQVMRKLQPGKAFLKRTASEVAVAQHTNLRPQLAAQARIIVQIVTELKRSVLILDEVSIPWPRTGVLALHPSARTAPECSHCTRLGLSRSHFPCHGLPLPFHSPSTHPPLTLRSPSAHPFHVPLPQVDLILHPLKSELNWPLGKRKPLDFGASRWAVPFHLLDALFFCSEGTMPDAWRANGTAKAILSKLHAAVAAGFEAKHLQRTPHLILISTVFYRAQLKPLLCRWMLIYLRKARLRELRDEQVLAYLMLGGSPPISADLPRSRLISPDLG